MEDIRSSGAEGYVMNGYYRLMRAVLQRGRSARIFNVLTTTGAGTLALLG